MRQLLLFLLFGLPVVAQAQVLPRYGGQRAGSTALSFLKADIAPRSAALGGASVAMPGNAQSLFINPAGIANVKRLSFGANQYWHGAGMFQSALYAVVPRKNGASSLGYFMNSLNSGPMEVRTEFQPNGTGERVFATNTAFGVSYGLQLTELFTFGVTGRFIYEQLAEYKNTAATFDFGFFYQTDWKDLSFAVMVQNFGTNTSLQGDFLAETFNRNPSDLENITNPNVFRLGVSMLAMDTERQKIRVSFELNHPNDNSENFRFGAEYDYMNLFFARVGYKINIEGHPYPVGGLGLRTHLGAHPLYIDYAVLPTDMMGLQQNVSLVFELNNDAR